MIDIRTGKEMTRRDFGKGIAAILSAGVAPSIAMGLVGSANASVGSGMMRNVGARNAAMFGEKKPYDAEVEYLDTEGTQYVNTGVIIELTDEVVVRYSALIKTNNSGIFGARISYSANNGFSLWAQAALNIPRMDLTSSTNPYVDCNIITIGKIHTFKKIGPLNYFDDIQIKSNGTVTSYTAQYDAYLFCINQAGSAMWGTKNRVYSCKIGTKRDFVPVRIGSGLSALGYMYDRYNQKGGPLGNGLYGNAADNNNGFPANLIGPDKV